MNHIYGYPHSKEAEFYKLLLDYDESLEKDLADCRAIWYESGTNNLMVGDYGMSDRIEAVVISKRFGFLERLVENDKINQQLLERYAMDYFNDESPVYGDNVRADRLIMILSVSNSPISDLIKLLDTEGGDDLKPSGKLVFNI